MTSTDVRNLAEKIAQILQTETKSSDLAPLYASIEKINSRLDKLESLENNLKSDISNLKFRHPSTDKFAVAEAIADEIFSGTHKEKACQFERGKPCDHCSMCNSRGF